MAIPKIIHIVWIGDESKRPDQWIATWKHRNPDYQLRVWGNEAVKAESWMLGDHINLWLNREINGAADIIRWEILFRYGGIAFDADSACVRPLEDWIIQPDCFAAWEHELLRPGLIAAGALGFTPNHFLTANILKDIYQDPNPLEGMAWQKLGPQRITDTVRELNFPNLTVYPSHFFYPKHHSGLEYTGTGPVFARQFWGSTHRGWGVENPDAANFQTDDLSLGAISTPLLATEERASVALDVTTGPEANQDNTEHGFIERSFNNNFYLQKLRVTEVAARLPYFQSLCRNKRVLHVGCTDFPVFDPNRNLHIQLEDVCSRLDGLDTDVEGMAILAEHVGGSYFSTAAAIEGSYDLLLVPETIEHVHNIQIFLNELDTIRFDNIVITAPCLIGWNACFNYADVAGWRTTLLGAPHDYIEEVHPDHKAWFTPYTLANCIEQFTTWRIEEILFLEGKRMIGVLCTKLALASSSDADSAPFAEAAE